ncbi:MAG: hypothetical protein PHQ90_13010 [Sulfuricurvum sp.]|uniref:hypothetical protein n=1 Tax=Sulfuricurvum sp. TaxID=2025608 RepID=UPI0026257CA1|nr:hypothetical protein [Sulfuricurvum sp.]MDD2370215.1 hypothetical protein [Sulfuricurvum sp.]MDD2951429.1 hypothetical protein [Sulfuricurvum sp.]MDD5117419.1 hypothetical protein [Sulfuricurvum sp.]
MNKIIELETILEHNGYNELLEACKAIVGSDGTEIGMSKSINEDGMKEAMGTLKVYWLKQKLRYLNIKKSLNANVKILD